MAKTALITGASSGIGRELARIHAQKGGDLVIVARRKTKLDQLKKELIQQYHTQVKVIAKDLTDPDVPQEIYDQLQKAHIQIDYLINNAGVGGRGKFHERKWELDRAMIQLNIVALTHLCRLFLPDFVARNSGKILNVGSTASIMPGPMQAVYYATKSYVQSFSNAIAEELHDTEVTVTNLMPGATNTEFAKVSGMNKTMLFKNTVSPKLVAQQGYQAMLDGKLNIISGLSFPQKILTLLIPFMPRKFILSTVRKMQEI